MNAYLAEAGILRRIHNGRNLRYPHIVAHSRRYQYCTRCSLKWANITLYISIPDSKSGSSVLYSHLNLMDFTLGHFSTIDILTPL